METNTNLKIQFYGKGIAVTGDTKPHTDILKRSGGRFNRFLTIGSGWVFGKAKGLEFVQWAKENRRDISLTVCLDDAKI